MRAVLSFPFRGREFRPAADLLSFASPKESKQRKGDPTVCDPSLRYGQPAVLAFRGVSQNSPSAQTAASPDPRNAALLGAARGEGELRAFASLGPGTSSSLMPWVCSHSHSHSHSHVYMCLHLRQRPAHFNVTPHASSSRREAPAAAHWPSEAKARWYPNPFCMRRGAERFADQGSQLSERSEFCETPRNVSTAGCPKRSAGTQTAGSPFFCLRFFGEAKKSRSPAGARPGLGKQPPNAVQNIGASR